MHSKYSKYKESIEEEVLLKVSRVETSASDCARTMKAASVEMSSGAFLLSLNISFCSRD